MNKLKTVKITMDSLKTVKEIYDFDLLSDLVTKKSNKDIYNWANALSDDDWDPEKWAKKHGLDTTCLDKPEESEEDWPLDSEEMKQRIKINSDYLDAQDGECLEKPYLNFRHWAIDNIFYEFNNGYSYYTFSPKQLLLQIKNEDEEWIKEILNYFIEVFKENNIPDEIEVETDW